ncbi:CoA-binding protein [Oceanobacillus profundus]|uniref:CoA-binding protein n=1 Tax=Oceanobacillus profundus TaxID=372463 RepID=A0A417Y9W6_9BACI|nr:CoA-binding protein [Oceanobacillus profundus]MCM3396534.1 CoA-binding protein [Oceanobacillus profundus]PAE29932.1 CoA-binding protein [Paenibacillus sp. 7884-2]RHW29469.1 CoA-binding protein [Oceanobacillus profundus]
MAWENPANDELKEILESAKTIAVVGLSNNQDKTAYQIAKIMQEVGYRIIPVNPTVEEVLGEKAYSSLTAIPDKIDIINIFRRPEYLPEIAKEAAESDCRIFWAQQGIVNEEAYHYLKERDFTVIMDLCIKVVHAVLVKK